jgi:uncharacterized membrane protein
MRWAAWIAAGLVCGAILHIAAVFGVPFLASRDSWRSLSASYPGNTLTFAEPGKPAPAFTPADVVQAYCPFDISSGNLILTMPLAEPSWSLAISTRAGENFYAVTGADARAPEARILLIPRDRLPDEASTERSEEGGEQTIVVSSDPRGLVVMRAPLRGESFRAQTVKTLKKARCELQKPIEPAPVVAAIKPNDQRKPNTTRQTQPDTRRPQR